MTVQVDLFTLIIMVAVIILVAFLLPMLWQLKKTAEQAEALLSELRRDLVPTIQELRETGGNLHQISIKAAKGAEKTESLIDAIDTLGTFMQQDVFRFVSYVECLMCGIRAAGKVLLKEARNKEVDL